jgi:hypothetical protein
MLARKKIDDVMGRSLALHRMTRSAMRTPIPPATTMSKGGAGGRANGVVARETASAPAVVEAHEHGREHGVGLGGNRSVGLPFLYGLDPTFVSPAAIWLI